MTDPTELARFGPLRRLSPAQLMAVAAIAQDVDVAAGTVLLRAGQDASGCWLIRSGRVALTIHVPGRGEVVVQTLGSGDLLGWSWLTPPHRWHLTATATAPVAAIVLDTSRLRALADRDPALGYPLALGFSEVLLERLQSTRSRLLDLYASPRGR